MNSISDRFRQKHLLDLLEDYSFERGPLDFYVSLYFRKNKALGSKDRAFISETIYALVRWMGLLDYICEINKIPVTWKNRLSVYQHEDWKSRINDTSIDAHTRVSFPKVLFDLFVESHGFDKAFEIALFCNEPAPTTVRVNTMKISREALLEKWKQDGYEVIPCTESSCGITFLKKINFFNLPEFTEGCFEVQDEASQLVADLVQVLPKEQVLDYCSGSGGKTLAFAAKLGGTGQIFLHDIRLSTLYEARRRLKRAGIQNAQILSSENKQVLRQLKKSMDWVLVDAPCTGTGTLRRNPDMKWRFTEEMLIRLVGQQRTIFEQAQSFVKPGGHIVYATCSILKQENRDQMDRILKIHPNLSLEGEVFESTPKPQSKDGMFAFVTKKALS